MINREIIRQKVVQIVYSYYQQGDSRPDRAEKELLMSMSKAYELYNYMLLLLVEMNRVALRIYQMRQSRLTRLGSYETENARFVNNRFMLQMESNRQLMEFRENHNRFWADLEEFVRSLYLKVEEQDFYKEYMSRRSSSFAEDREVWRLIYRQLICNNDELDALLEEQSLYWNDDKTVVDTFVLKTLNRFTEQSSPDMPLLPEFRDDADREFAIRLLRRTLANAEYLQSLIAGSTRRWDVERVALMDRVIMQVALAEITSFPTIPLGVSINEYVELAKTYSTPKSGKYVNASLDHISKQLIEEKKLVKAETATTQDNDN
ncbi:MAG: transcription antitermination factor NusB [Bacteroidaceae bacterium]|nr:transcription antitermination factor NusB [Bacteroidaceae bacterium]